MSVQTSLSHLDAFREVQGTFGTAKPEDQYSCRSSSGTLELEGFWLPQANIRTIKGKLGGTVYLNGTAGFQVKILMKLKS